MSNFEQTVLQMHKFESQFQCPIQNRTLNENGTFACIDFVVWRNTINPKTEQPYDHFLVEFSHIHGTFELRNATHLTTLKGCPGTVDGSFRIDAAYYLTDLKDGPKVVTNLNCQNSGLRTLAYCPQIDKNCTLINLPELTTLEHLKTEHLQSLMLKNCPALQGLHTLPDAQSAVISTNNDHIFTIHGWPTQEQRTKAIQFHGIPAVQPDRDWWRAFLQDPRALHIFVDTTTTNPLPEWACWLNQYDRDKDYLQLVARVNTLYGEDKLIPATTTGQEITEKLDITL